MRQVELITRVGCHLCEDAQQLLNSLRSDYEFELKVLDVDLYPELKSKFSDQVPVVKVDGQVVAYWVVNRAILIHALTLGPQSISVPPL